MSKGISLLDLKKQNRHQMLKLLRYQGGLSRKDIAARLNLTPAAVTIITADMVESGLIRELGTLKAEGRPLKGRRKVMVDINYDYRYVVGVYSDAVKTDIGICNMQGDVKFVKTFSNKYSGDFEKDIKYFADIINEVIRESRIDKDILLGIGISMYGRYNDKTNENYVINKIYGRNINIIKEMQKYFDLPVTAASDIVTQAVAEYDYHPGRYANNENVLFITLEPEFSTIFMNDGNIIHGENGLSGNVRGLFTRLYITEKRDDYGLTIEQYLNEILNKIKSKFSKEATPKLYRVVRGNEKNINMVNVLRASEECDKSIEDDIEEIIMIIAYVISNVIIYTDPSRIVFLLPEKVEFDAKFKKIISDTGSSAQMSYVPQNYSKYFTLGASVAIRKFFYDIGGYDYND